ncbi:MAG: ATP-grasp domain-containing protein [Deltaproteobacteria bacterium]|jgi:biotin carboxylase|nr:ATP-grasp domain-containing protein [Deltaproteobacteria bacterium]
MTATVWFNHGFSSLHNICGLLRQGAAEHGRRPRIVLSHSNPDFVARPQADLFFTEPDLPDDSAYVDWCLETVRRRQIDVLWPSRRAAALAARRDELEALGARLLCPASPEVHELLEDKAACYRAAASLDPELIPLHRVARTFGEFERAVEELSALTPRLCLKPAKSLFGLGFKILTGPGGELAAFLGGDPVRASLAEARAKLDVPDEAFRKLLVMEYLEGPEFSLDCLALDGRLLRASVREKPLAAGRPERLIRDEELVGWAERLTRLFKLSWIVNIQFRRGRGRPRLLEINPRMAGGLYFSCLAGINYPYWALRLALEPCEDQLPDQLYDLQVAEVHVPFIYR